MLQAQFEELISPYTQSQSLKDQLWMEIDAACGSSKRHYHNLSHLEQLMSQLQPIREQIHDWPTLLFTLFYHDLVYRTHRKDNEEQSALMAEKRMHSLGVSFESIEKCKHQIRCTQSHEPSDSDTNFFTDADLSILGSSLERYELYTQQIRKEYQLYPDLLYKPGRKKVLAHFLEMDRIYKTDYFYQKFEDRCRQNLKWELDSLS
ncbi:hypothetical protein KFE98_13345 [bacterium SCSIO 12741]|nr:hypothetical protein KFE98_13345 [bacterium SCSIO 12741]